MKNQLIVTLILNKDSALICEILKLIQECKCNIADSRLLTIQSDYVWLLQMGGHWDSIVKVESALTAFAKKHNALLSFKRSDAFQYQENLVPYYVQLIGLDRPGIVYSVCEFFCKQNITIQEVYTNRYITETSQTPMGYLTLSIFVSSQASISSLRESFLLLCEELNVDGMIEPDKNL